MLLPDQTYEGAAALAAQKVCAGPADGSGRAGTELLAALLRTHRVKPDFFCAYRGSSPPTRSADTPRRYLTTYIYLSIIRVKLSLKAPAVLADRR